jgi:undecaprenyl-diphosphatase
MFEVFYLEFEKTILDFFQSMHGSFFDYIVLFITLLGDMGLVWFIIAIICLFFKRTRTLGVVTIISVIVPTIINDYAFKPLINRARPFIAFDEYEPFVENIFSFKFALIGGVPTKGSMMSGHTIGSFSAAGTILMFNKKYGLLSLALAFLIGFSRIYLLVHFPSDVFLGVIWGLLFGISFGLIYKRLILKKFKEKKG